MSAFALSTSALPQLTPRSSAQKIDPNLQASADTERAFARLGAEKGFRFTPHPKKTVKELHRRPAPTGPLPPRRVEWAPMYGDVGDSGDLGYHTGPSKVTDHSGQQPPRYGYFFSLWKKQPNGDRLIR